MNKYQKIVNFKLYFTSLYKFTKTFPLQNTVHSTNYLLININIFSKKIMQYEY